MSSSEIAINVEKLSKRYEIYEKPSDRLKQFVLPRLRRLLNSSSRQYFKEFWALRDVSFQIEKGETLGIIGRNGSGKSTLLQMICGTLNPTEGSILTNGRIAALLELGSGFNPEFTGRENVHMNASVLGLTNEEIHDRFDAIARFADIGEFIEQPVKTYSSGMMVRLAFAVIAHVDADILVIDEALAVGDAFFTQKCMRFLREFMKDGTILFVSHDTASIKNLCNYAIWLEKGKIVQQGSPKDVCESYLEAYYEIDKGKNTTTIEVPKSNRQNNEKFEDQRSNFLNSSNLRNDLQVFEFNPESPSFGIGGAQIKDVQFLNEEHMPLAWVVGGESVILRIIININEELKSPIVGFYIKDRLGQTLFGDNTYLTYGDFPLLCPKGSDLQADFAFVMPMLAKGDYSISTAIANGTQTEHVQHHWIHDAVIFKSEYTSVSTGLIGIPMRSISMNIRKEL